MISIIALLLSILMPTLGKVKNQARLTLDVANCKQIYTLLAIYMTENSDHVPIILNQFSRVPANLDPEGMWTWNQFEEYCDTKLPKYYNCPFVRNKGNSKKANTVKTGKVTISGPAGSRQYDTFRNEGPRENYRTSMWWLRKDFTYTSNHPYGPPHGSAQYGAYKWYDDRYVPRGRWNSSYGYNEYKLLKNIKWSSRKLAKHTGSSSAANNTILSCVAGQFDGWSNVGDGGIYNYQSHMKGKYGGSG